MQAEVFEILFIGVTKPEQVDAAAGAANVVLSAEEIARIEAAASATGAQTRGSWEKPMV